MPQQREWEQEYRNSKFITKHDKPQKFFLRYLKYLRKEKKINIDKLKILDLGSGTGRNANYLAELGAKVYGLEISNTAVQVARERAKELGVLVEYYQRSMGDEYPFEDNYFDLVLDITSSNSLDEKEREIYLSEVKRVLKLGGYFFVRALCKDGDKNAKQLIKLNPGKEKDTYILPETGITERVFSREDLVEQYSKNFDIIKLIKEIGYSKFNNRSYKRNFWIGYLRKKV